MRSALLYYRKHHGWKGAFLAKKLESYWHTLVAEKNGRSGAPERKVKADHSTAIVALMQQAWQETRGGRISPPRPW